MAYPSTLDAIPLVSAGQLIAAAYWNSLTLAIVAVENAVYTNPAGPYSSVQTALAGKLDFTGASMQFATDTGSVNAFVVTVSPFPNAYAEGQLIYFQAATTNTASCTLNVNTLGTVSIYKEYNVALVAGDIVAGQVVVVQYDDRGYFQMLSMPSSTSSNPGGGAYYGNGASGPGNITSNHNLTQDMYYTTLTVASGATLNTAGFRVFVSGQLTCNGTIANNGGAGGNGTGSTGGSGGTAGAGNISSAGAGGAGGAGGRNSSGAGGSAPTHAILGGHGGSGGGTGGSGGGGTAFARPYDLRSVSNAALLTNFAASYFGGGGGGGGGGSTVLSSGGGGGGGGGGLIFIAARTITGSGAIEANGGTGGNSFNSSSSGGGGGGGGVVILICNSTSITPSASGGAAGSGGTGQAAGQAGTVLQIFN